MSPYRITGANAATLVTGDTKAGKTTLLATFAEWLWRTHKVVTRYYSSDPGGYGDKMLALIEVGIVHVYRMVSRDPEGKLGLAHETLIRCMQGWWPAEVDPATGLGPAAVKLLPPHPDARFGLMADGLTSMTDWASDEMGVRHAEGTLSNENNSLKVLKSGSMTLGQNTRAGVGFLQDKARTWIKQAIAVPNLVAPPVFTALEQKAVDKDASLMIYGPKIAGNAKAAEVPSWVGNCLVAAICKDEDGNDQHRLYTRLFHYPADDSAPHLAGHRCSDQDLIPEFLADAPGEPRYSGFNLGRFFDLLNAGLEKELGRVKEAYPDAPGAPGALPEGAGPMSAEVATLVATTPTPGSPRRVMRRPTAAQAAEVAAGAASTVQAAAATVQAAAATVEAALAATAPAPTGPTPAPAARPARTRPRPAAAAPAVPPAAPPTPAAAGEAPVVPGKFDAEGQPIAAEASPVAAPAAPAAAEFDEQGRKILERGPDGKPSVVAKRQPPPGARPPARSPVAAAASTEKK